MIERDGYKYNLNAKYKDKLFYKCEDKKNIGCKGVWKLYLVPNQPHQMPNDNSTNEGQIHRPHTEPFQNHQVYSTKIAKKEEKRGFQPKDEDIEAMVFLILTWSPDLQDDEVMKLSN